MAQEKNLDNKLDGFTIADIVAGELFPAGPPDPTKLGTGIEPTGIPFKTVKEAKKGTPSKNTPLDPDDEEAFREAYNNRFKDEDDEVAEDKEENEEEEIEDEESNEEDTQEEVEVAAHKRSKPKTSTKKDEEEKSELGEYEKDITSYVLDEFVKESGVTLGKDDKIESVKDFVAFVSKVVAENSAPEFANEDIATLDKYVREGGDLKQFYQEVFSGVDPDSVDMEDVSQQKLILRDYLKTQGLSDTRIAKKIEQYEDKDVLEDEAKDAVDLLKEYKAKRAETLLEQQEKSNQQRLKQQQTFMSTVQESIKSLDNIKGIPIASQDKKDLFEYMFKPEADGSTKYQKDFNKNYTQNLIETALYLKMGNDLFGRANKQATSNAARTLKQKLESKGKRISGRSVDQDDSNSPKLSQFSKYLINEI